MRDGGGDGDLGGDGDGSAISVWGLVLFVCFALN